MLNPMTQKDEPHARCPDDLRDMPSPLCVVVPYPITHAEKTKHMLCMVERSVP